jgi:Na+/H+-translocating membrane pyrophosphatase
MNAHIGSPSTDDEVRKNFIIKGLGTTLFLLGFTSLACYLALPAEFQIKQLIVSDDPIVTTPVFAYLCVIIGMILCLLITFSAEIVGSRAFFIYSMLKSCKAGAATALISVLSMGYFYTALPVISLASFGYLCHCWLGSFGVGMGLIGMTLYLPFYLNSNLYHSTMNIASMIAYVSKSDEDTISRLFSLN